MRRQVRWAVLVAIWLCGTAASADWEVKRRSGAGLHQQAVRALVASPDAPGLAARVLRASGAGDAAATIALLRAAAAKSPTSYGPVEALAQALRAAGRDDEAAEVFARAMLIKPAATAPALGRARALATARKTEAAFTAYDAALTRSRGNSERRVVLQAMVALATGAGDGERELRARRELAQASTADPQATLDLAAALARAGRPGEAAQIIEQQLRSGERRLTASLRARLMVEAAMHRQAAGDDEPAERLLRESLDGPRPDAERADLYRRLREVARRRDTLQLLEGTLEARLARGGRGMVVEWQALTDVRLDLGNLDGALAAARRALAADPHATFLRRKVIALLDRLGRDRELMEAYDGAQAGSFADPALTIDLIERKLRRGERDDARGRFDRALRSFRGSREDLAKLADLASRWSEDERVLAAWDAVLALAPRDERAIVGLGEAHFQRGRRELARKTWYQLLAAVRPRALAHARLAELLGDHDLTDEAVVQARAAQNLAPGNPQYHRVLARVLERRKEYDGAVSEWRSALEKSAGSQQVAERREARSRLVLLLAREGRSKLEEEARVAQTHLARSPGDREITLFLTEVYLRLQDPQRAIETLAAATDRAPDDPEIVMPLVRMLRQSGQTSSAIARLETLARATMTTAPSRAREALLQLAEIQLPRFEDAQTMATLDQVAALAADDPDTLVRAAGLQERMVATEQASLSYRKAIATSHSTRAALALYRLMVRRGDGEAAAGLLRQTARQATDDETLADVLKQDIETREFLGTLHEFDRHMSTFPSSAAGSWRKLWTDLLDRLVPPLYEATFSDSAAAARLARLSRRGLRPLVDLLTDPDADPDPHLVELAGLLGNRDAAPVLSRLAVAATARPRAPATSAAPMAVQAAAVVALGRLRDPRALTGLKALAVSAEPDLRAAAVWALGRLGLPQAMESLLAAASDPRPDVAALACVGLGRLRRIDAAGPLTIAALAVARPLVVRRAAVLALALSGQGKDAAVLLPLLEASDPTLVRGAMLALGATRNRRALPALLGRAMFGTTDEAAAARQGLDLFAGAATFSDDARAVRGYTVDAGAVLEALATVPPARTNDTNNSEDALLGDHTDDLVDILARALDGTGPPRLAALQALDSGPPGQPGIALGKLLPSYEPLSPTGERMLDEIGGRLRDRIAASLDDPDPGVRLLALRLSSRLADPRVTVSHVVAALAAAEPWTTGKPDSGAEATARYAARIHLTRGTFAAAALAAALRGELQHPAWERRLSAYHVLALGGAAVRLQIVRGLDDPNAFVRAEAALALADDPGALAETEAAAALERATRDPATAVRDVATRALAAPGTGARPR